jgi:hypothetical protein
MLFIPCRGGVSHRPDEYASPEWIGSGVTCWRGRLQNWPAEASALHPGAPLYAMPQPVRHLRFPNHEHACDKPASLAPPFPARKAWTSCWAARATSTTSSARACGTAPPSAAPFPRGLIRSIGFDRRIDWSEFTVVTAADIPGENHIQLIVADQPCLADGKVNHCDEADRAARAS